MSNLLLGLPLLPLCFLQLPELQDPAPVAEPAEDASESAEDLSELLAPIALEYGVPGMGCALIVDGELVGLGAAGLRAAGAPERVTTTDLWHLGSCTKAMTATLAARLVERGELTWATTLAEGFKGTRVHADLRAVTLEQLLTHTAGLMPNPTVGSLWLRLRGHAETPVEGRALVVAEVLPLAPEVPPGTRMLYSNTGYMIAGAMLERRADEAWEALMAREVFGPLGMRSAGFGAPGTPDAVSQPRGHNEQGEALPPGANADNPSALGPAGTVHATLADWARFVLVHLGHGPEGYLTGETLAKLHTPPASPSGSAYALGWGTAKRDWATGPILTHSGSNTFWFCTAWLAPEEGFAVLVTVNQAGEAGSKAAEAACVMLLELAGRL